MKESRKIITPLTTQGGKKSHVWVISSKMTTYEQKYFSRKTAESAKPRVIRS